jgi:glycosyltransferase EpsD
VKMANKRKKVLFTATVDSHILSFHLPFLKMLQEKGYEVHVATNGTAEIPHCDVRHTVSFHRSPFKLDNLRAIGQLKKIVDREHYDIIHTHTPMGGVVTRLAALDARKKGTRVIYTAHGFHFFKGAPLLNWLIYYPIEWLLARKTDDLITINQEDYKRAKSKFKTKVHYVPGVGVDPKKFDFKFTKADKTKLRKELGLKDSDFVMIYPAELNKNKNQTMLIEVMESLAQNHPGIQLLLPGKDSLDGFHARLAKEKGLENNIHFLGFRKDIPQLVKISDLAVSASKREGLPVNIIEAMTVGLPVVATACRGASELVKDQLNGVVVSIGDTQGMTNSIRQFIVDEKARVKAGKASANASGKYKLEIIVDRMSDIYRLGVSR